MKIAFISTILDYPWGGADFLWTRAAEAASERGDQLFISVSPTVAASPRIAALRAAGATIHERTPAAVPTSFVARLARKLGSLTQRRSDRLVAALKALQPDLVIFSLGGTYDLTAYPAWFAWLRASGTKFRLIANWQQENPILTDPERALACDILTHAEQVNFVSTRNLEVTRRHLLHPLPHAQVIQNPLRWQPSDVSPWPAAPGCRLATVSRLHEGKGIQLLLHAAAHALALEHDWQLNIYGQGPAEIYLRATAAHLGLTDRVHFRGHVRELQAIWAENHLMISPSLDDGVPMTIPEAMLCERPVLATAVGGAEDWLRHGETGYLCAAPTLPLLSSTLREAWEMRDHWSDLGRAAALVAHTHYQADDYLKLLP